MLLLRGLFLSSPCTPLYCDRSVRSASFVSALLEGQSILSLVVAYVVQ